MHKVHKVYVAELIFGHLLTSSNYDDTIKKVTGGRNGFGAKLTNIFSKEFIVETVDKKAKKKLRISWVDNMNKIESLDVGKADDEEDYTKVSFRPDLSKFGLKGISNDVQALMMKRVFDLAGVISSKVAVYLNNKKIKIKSF